VRPPAGAQPRPVIRLGPHLQDDEWVAVAALRVAVWGGWIAAPWLVRLAFSGPAFGV